jgi:hypothetical protein
VHSGSRLLLPILEPTLAEGLSTIPVPGHARYRSARSRRRARGERVIDEFGDIAVDPCAVA